MLGLDASFWKNSMYRKKKPCILKRGEKITRQFSPCYLIWILIDNSGETGRKWWSKRAKEDITRQLSYNLKCIFYWSYRVFPRMLFTKHREVMAKSHDQNRMSPILTDNYGIVIPLSPPPKLVQWGIRLQMEGCPRWPFPSRKIKFVSTLSGLILDAFGICRTEKHQQVFKWREGAR